MFRQSYTAIIRYSYKFLNKSIFYEGASSLDPVIDKDLTNTGDDSIKLASYSEAYFMKSTKTRKKIYWSVIVTHLMFVEGLDLFLKYVLFH
jgi:hypothetical protein